MKVTRNTIPDVLILESPIFEDERGSFMELWRQQQFDEAVGHPVRFVQDNWSHSEAGVLRGLHYQLAPRAQGKLVRVLRGAVFDVAVDLRRGSATLGRWCAVELSAGNGRMQWVPPGFAHGFLVLGDGADVLYKCTDTRAPELERTLRWDDPAVGIAWPLGDRAGPVLSAKDHSAPSLAGAELISLADDGAAG